MSQFARRVVMTLMTLCLRRRLALLEGLAERDVML